MYYLVYHRNITDWKRFHALTDEVKKAPTNLKSLAYFPATDHRSAVCIWNADSETSLRRYLDGLCAGLSTNDFVQIDANIAQGVPKVPAVV